MKYLVEFLEVGARVIKDPEEIQAKKDSPNVLIEPPLQKVIGISPSFWERNGDEVVAIRPEDRANVVGYHIELSKKQLEENNQKTRDEILNLFKSISEDQINALHQSLNLGLENDRKQFNLLLDTCNNEITQLQQAIVAAKKHITILYVIGILSVAACIALRLL